MHRIVVTVSVFLGSVIFLSEAFAQFQINNRQQFGGLSTGAFGVQQGGLGAQPRGIGSQGGIGRGSQFGQRGIGGGRGQGIGQGFGQGFRQQARAGSAQAVSNFFESLGGRQQQTANINRFVENLNELRDSQSQQRGQQRNYAPVRVRIRPAFSVAPIDPAVMEPALKAQLERSLEISGSTARARVTYQAGLATITGTVEEDHEREVLEKMLALQPGVRQVDNQLVVEESVPVMRRLDSGLPTPPPVQ